MKTLLSIWITVFLAAFPVVSGFLAVVTVVMLALDVASIVGIIGMLIAKVVGL